MRLTINETPELIEGLTHECAPGTYRQVCERYSGKLFIYDRDIGLLIDSEGDYFLESEEGGFKIPGQWELVSDSVRIHAIELKERP